jgi:hypothetical protein
MDSLVPCGSGEQSSKKGFIALSGEVKASEKR